MKFFEHFKLSNTAAIVVIVLAGLLVYSPSLRNQFVWDDQVQIVDNPLVHSLNSVPELFKGSTAFNPSTQSSLGAFYRPVAAVLTAAIYSLFGPNPLPFHLVQIGFHICNAILLFYLLAHVINKRMGFILALLFLVHPIGNEAVVFMSALSEVLFMFFGLLALAVLMKEPFKQWDFLPVGLLLLLAALSKETGLMFVPIALLFRWLIQRKPVKVYVVMAGVAGAVYAILRFSANLIPHRPHEFPLIDLSLGERLINVPAIIGYYFKTLAFPWHLAVSQQWLVDSVLSPAFYFPLVFVALLVGVLLVWIRHVYRRNPKSLPLIIFFSAWVALGLGLVMQIVPLEMTVADRWFYMPLAGLLGLIGLLLAGTNLSSKVRLGLIYGVVPLILVLSIRNVVRSTNWYDNLSLFEHDAAISQNSPTLENNLGFALYGDGRRDEALPHFEAAAKLNPYSAVYLNNLGTVYYRAGDFAKAEHFYRQSLSLGNVVSASEELAKLLLIHNSPQAALEFTTHQLEKLPYNPTLWTMQAIAQYKLGMRDQALQSIQRAYEILPSEYVTNIRQVITDGGEIAIN